MIEKENSVGSRREFRGYFIFLLVFFCSVLFITEAILQYKKTRLSTPTIEKRNRVTKLSVMKELREKGVDVYPHFAPQGYIHINDKDGISFKGEKIFPLSFISNTKTIFCIHETGNYIIFRSDEHGFNNPQKMYKKLGIDIILIGDSNAEGYCVNQTEDTAGWLRKSGKRALTLGMQSNGPLLELAILKEYGKPLKPGSVFWLYSEVNDERDILSEKKSLFLKQYLNKEFTQNLYQKQELIDNAITAFMDKFIADWKKNGEIFDSGVEEPMSNILMKFLTMSLVRNALGIGNECSVKIDPLFKDIIAEAKKSISDWGGQLFFVYLPGGERWGGKSIHLCRKRYMRSHKEGVLSIMKELGIPVIDIHEALKSSSDPISFFNARDKIHFNSEGHRLIAQEIYKVLPK